MRSGALGMLCQPSPVLTAFVRQVQVSQQATLGCQAMDAGKERLQSFKSAPSLQRDQFGPPPLPRLMPLLCDADRTFRCVGYTYLLKPCLLNQSLILSRRTVHVIIELRVAISSWEIIPPTTSASLKSIRPPGFRTRKTSHNTLSRPGIWHKTSFANTASKASSL